MPGIQYWLVAGGDGWYPIRMDDPLAVVWLNKGETWKIGETSQLKADLADLAKSQLRYPDAQLVRNNLIFVPGVAGSVVDAKIAEQQALVAHRIANGGALPPGNRVQR